MCSFHILISGVLSTFDKYRQGCRETTHNQYSVQGCMIQTILYLIFLLIAVLQPQVVMTVTTYDFTSTTQDCVWFVIECI